MIIIKYFFIFYALFFYFYSFKALALEGKKNISNEIKIEFRTIDYSQFPEIILDVRLKDPVGRTVSLERNEQIFLWETVGNTEKDVKEPLLKKNKERKKNNKLGVVFLLDTSFSLNPHLDSIRNFIKNYVALLHPGDVYGLIEMHGKNKSRVLLPEIEKIIKKDDIVEPLNSALSKLKIDPQYEARNLTEAVLFSLEKAQSLPVKRSVVIVLSDSYRTTVQQDLLLKTAKHKKIPIYFVGLGHPYWHQSFQKIASGALGLYTPILPNQPITKLVHYAYAHAVDSPALKMTDRISYRTPLALNEGKHFIRLRLQTDKDKHYEISTNYFVATKSNSTLYKFGFFLFFFMLVFVCIAWVILKKKKLIKAQDLTAFLDDLSEPQLVSHKSKFQGKLMIAESADQNLKPGDQILLKSDQELTIGRKQSNQLVIADPLVSGCHAVIKPDIQGKIFIIFDISSANGTYLNHQKISQAELQSGDYLQIGSTVFAFSLDKTSSSGEPGGER